MSEAVPTTVWFALVDGKAYVFTGANSGKAKRIHNNPRVTLTPSNFRGKSPQRKASWRQEPASWTRAKRRCPTGP